VRREGRQHVLDAVDPICCRPWASSLAGYIGANTQHYALAGGLVVPEGADLRARNLPDSADSVDVQLLGYIVNEPGLAVGAPFPFNPLL
jgi:hypothetical protein